MKLFLLLQRFRLLRLWRLVPEMGGVRVAFLLGFGGYLLWLSWNLLLEAGDSSWLWASAGVLLLAQLHLLRADRGFVAQLSRRPGRIFAGEYLLLSLPFAAAFAVAGRWAEAGALAFTAPWVGSMPWRVEGLGSQRRLRLPGWLALHFELVSGGRQTWLWWLLVMGLSLLASHLPVALILGLAVLSATFAYYFVICEDKDLLMATGKRAGAFLRWKMGRQLVFSLLALAPLALAQLALHPEQWKLLAVVMVWHSLLQALAVVLKYSSYDPGHELTGNGILIGFSVLCLLVVWLVPVPLALLLFKLPKALDNLKNYLPA